MHNASGVPILPEYGDISDPAVRAKYAYLQSGICLGGNAFLLSAKLLLAIVWSSVAVLGDALNHTADVAVSLVIILAFWWSKKEADEEHPHGHGRIEHILAVVVASMIVFMGILIIREALERLANPTIESSILFAGLMVIFSGVKISMAVLSFSVAKKIQSNAIKGDAWNHTTDVLISLSLAAVIFITTFSPDYKILDPIFGIVVACIVMYAGFRLIHESSSILIGEAPSREMIRKVKSAALSVRGVRDAHDIAVHDYGPSKVVSLHIVVDENISAQEAHRIATEVEETIEVETSCKPTAHIEVIEPTLSEVEIENLVRTEVKSHKAVSECLRVSVIPRSGGGDILLTVAVDGNLSVRDTDRILREIEGNIKVRLPHYHTTARAVPHGRGPRSPGRQGS